MKKDPECHTSSDEKRWVYFPLTCAKASEGEDRWDDASAKFLQSYLITSQGLSEEEAEPYFQAIHNKDPADKKFTTDVQKIVHDADCLEIIRVLPDAKNFRAGELSASLDPAIIAEWALFIKQTDDPAFGLQLEHTTENTYADVMRVLGASADKYPKICAILKEEWDAMLV